MIFIIRIIRTSAIYMLYLPGPAVMNEFRNQPLPPVLFEDAGRALQHFLDGDRVSFSRLFILTDENTHRYCLPVLLDGFSHKFHSIVTGAGEEHKTLDTCAYIWRQLREHGADRQSLLINLGGGMVTDLGGYAASCFMRGIRFVNIPTSLLGMVDAAIGGKCGVDLDGYKNMIGNFAYPEAVIIDNAILKTLPEKEFRCGMVEVFKHGLIADEMLWNRLLRLVADAGHLSWSGTILQEMNPVIRSAVEIKNSIVSKDPLEINIRKYLNFGHTIGHAIETYSLRHDAIVVTHGEAVAAGMVCEAFLSSKLCGLSTGSLTDIKSLMKQAFPSMHIRHEAFSELIHLMKADKKSVSGAVIFALLAHIGKPELVKVDDEGLIYESFHFFNS